MVFHEYNPDAAVGSYNFIMAFFGIQMHGIPRKLMFAENITYIATRAGHLLEMKRMPMNEILNWKFAKELKNTNYCHKAITSKQVSQKKTKKKTEDILLRIQFRFERIF